MTSDLAEFIRPSGWLGHSIEYFASTGSTNDVALTAARSGESEGLVVIADDQRTGRGRRQRQWVAPAGSSLLVSMLFRPPEPFSYYASRTTMACGLGLQRAVEQVCGIGTKLKWPNDLILEPGAMGNRTAWGKLAGMLSEVWLSNEGEPSALVVGLGVNVNIPEHELTKIASNALSLSALTNGPVDRPTLLTALLEGVEARYDALLAGWDPLPTWRDALAWVGEPIEIVRDASHVSGIFQGVDGDGNLLIRRATGDTVRFSAGDVSLRPA